MNPPDKSTGFRYALFFSVLFLFLTYPSLFLFLQTPLRSLTWGLQDGIVSSMVFVPGMRMLQYELFHNCNLLWSNLMGLGLPFLGNGVQAAPLFPLTLLLCWLPESIFWNTFILIRLALIGTGTFLVARNLLKFNKIGSAVFTLCFAYSLFPMRWMNHPWQNGLLAGIWYLYFLD